jgi:hypothetical protein
MILLALLVLVGIGLAILVGLRAGVLLLRLPTLLVLLRVALRLLGSLLVLMGAHRYFSNSTACRGGTTLRLAA